MLLRFDPFRELDRLTDELWRTSGTRTFPVPMDAVRRNDRLVITFDLPGIDPQSLELTVERNQLTLTAQRAFERDEDAEVLVAERPTGTFTRRVFLGENLDTDHIEADYHDGVLYVSIPVAEAAKPKKISVSAHGSAQAIDAHGSAEPIDAQSTETEAPAAS